MLALFLAAGTLALCREGVPAIAVRTLEYLAGLAQLDTPSRYREIGPMQRRASRAPPMVRSSSAARTLNSAWASGAKSLCIRSRPTSLTTAAIGFIGSASAPPGVAFDASFAMLPRGSAVPAAGTDWQSRGGSGAEDGRKNTFAGPHQPRQGGLVEQHAVPRLALRQGDAVGDDEPEHPPVPKQPPA